MYSSIDDLVTLPADTIERLILSLLGDIHPDRMAHWIAVAFKTATPELQDKLHSSVPDDVLQAIQLRSSEAGAVSLADVEVAQGWLLFNLNLPIGDRSA